jgi:alkylation response protein AidB-like acyl-CoA dehydrogenase
LPAAIANMARQPKYWISELQNRVIDDCLQLHGAYGYTNEFRLAACIETRVCRAFMVAQTKS